ncbi:Zn-dependent exopeptidase [Ramicandelaber brevisporus]|nr:Zn-dependent exopeptidase [Ramicandelaber brevisporus]
MSSGSLGAGRGGIGAGGGHRHSRPLPCVQTLTHPNGQTILSLAATSTRIFGGSQDGSLIVWDAAVFSLEAVIPAHYGSGGISSLILSPDSSILFSGASDGIVRAWNTATLDKIEGDVPLSSALPCGDSSSSSSDTLPCMLGTLFLGGKNTSIQWFNIAARERQSRTKRERELLSRKSRFFDHATADADIVRRRLAKSLSVSMSSSSTSSSSGRHKMSTPSEMGGSSAAEDSDDEIDQYVIFDDTIHPAAHYGYVYSLLLAPIRTQKLSSASSQQRSSSDQSASSDSTELVLFSGSGMGDVKLWRLQQTCSHSDGYSGIKSIELLHTLQPVNSSGCGVFSMAVSDELLYVGTQKGTIHVWDLETLQIVRSIRRAHGEDGDVMALTLCGPYVCSGGADGTVAMWANGFERVSGFPAHSDGVLAIVTAAPTLYTAGDDEDQYSGNSASGGFLLTAGGTKVRVWDALPILGNADFGVSTTAAGPYSRRPDPLLAALAKWVAIPSVSGHAQYQNDCRLAARFLRDLLRELGAESHLLAGADGRNPLVYGRFRATSPKTPAAPTALFYGHYDVMPANPAEWSSPPFSLSGRDGYLYGRGVTDNKGPILAAVFATSELHQDRLLECDVVFFIEGEEENGSAGIREALASLPPLNVDMVLLSNSYWIGEEWPCLTYGLRGTIRATISLESDSDDAHSGVHGGTAAEPVNALTMMLGKLTSQAKVFDGFGDDVRSMTDEEERDYLRIATIEPSFASRSSQEVARRLMQRWRYPTISVHSINSSSGMHSTVIPHRATAHLSMRTVPDQDGSRLAAQFKSAVEHAFAEAAALHSHSGTLTLSTDVRVHSDWWLGDRASPFFEVARKAIRDEWKTRLAPQLASLSDDDVAHLPLLIREGGSIPAVRLLETHFNCTAIQLPLGQSTDNAHLKDERIRLLNLQAGKRVIKRVLQGVLDACKLRNSQSSN